MYKAKRNSGALIVAFFVSFIFFPGLMAEAADRVHTVASKETVESIARTYHISTAQLMDTNGLPDSKLYAGQKLRIIQTAYTPAVYQWSERGKRISNYARTFVGLKKMAGEETPENGFDSSGLIHWVLSGQNVSIDRLTVDGFYKQGMDTSSPKAGDLIFFLEKDGSKVVTAGIYLGKNQFVHSGYGAETVQVRSSTENYFGKYNIAYKTYVPKGEHIVQSGETLKMIAEKYGISMDTIKIRNALPSYELIKGQYLQIYSSPLFPFYVNQETAYDEAEAVIKYAYTFRGFTYVFGGDDPMMGMDCSGFIYWVMKEQGLSVKRGSAEDYFSLLPHIENPKAGDLVFFRDTGARQGVTHVGIYLGAGRFLHTTEKPGVHISTLSSGYFAEKFESFGQGDFLIN
ncbi:C40 family peptidase [Peribacillus sp. SI8-4]|uniref:C40 family peptidase n=1 Tax=Peribacillus sp. SI8-4 TaxID=3048009 RepID=UPI0025569F3E|nr:C40 family peptidase [Peribacillus sp. SI8-4]